MRSRFLFGQVRGLAAAAACAAVLAGVPADAAKPDKVARKKAWIIAKSLCTFPLAEGALPQSAAELEDALVGGMGRSPATVDERRAIAAADGTLPALDSLRVDVSRSRIDPDDDGPGVARKAPVDQRLTAGRVELIAKAMSVRGSSMDVHLTADDAVLQVVRDRAGHPLIQVTEARRGVAKFSASVADLEKLLKDSANADVDLLGFAVDGVKLNLVAQTPRTLRGSLQVDARVAFVGAGLHFTGDVAIDDRMNATLSNLTCTGDDVLGPIVVRFLRPTLARYNNRTKPIVLFPAGKTQLRDVRFAVDDHVRVVAAFGSE